MLLSSLGLVGLMEIRRALTARQLELDRCVARRAHSMRDSLQAVERANARMRALRAAALAQALAPEARPAFNAALGSLVAGQELERARWTAAGAGWTLGIGCSRGAWGSSPYPAFPWTRPPADVLGPRPLAWSGPEPRRFRITLRDRPRAASGVVEKGGPENGSNPDRWLVRWAVPR